MTFRKGRLEASLEASGVDTRERLLDPEVAQRLEQRFVGSFRRDVDLDGIDVVALGVAGAVGAAVDLLLVAIPSDVNYLGQYPQSGSVLTKFLKRWVVPSDNALARHAKVPFDQLGGNERVPGMFPGNHRFLTPGHDPILGLVIGVFDILRGGRTAIGTDGIWRFDGGLGEPTANIARAVVLEVVHLISDVATKVGLPAPLMTAAGLLRVGSFGERQRTVADLARYMYLEGYDLRHFVTTCSAPMAIRLLLGGYFLGRKFVDEGYEESCLAMARRGTSFLNHPRLQMMTLLADGIACAANVGKIALYHGNPSAFNYAQWLALVRGSGQFLLNQAESPTEVLIDRAHANEVALQRRWLEIRVQLPDADLPEPGDAF